MASLNELLVPQTPQQVFDQLLAVFKSAGFPVDAWQLGGIERTRDAAYSKALSDVSASWIPILASSGFVQLAATLPGAWLDLVGEQVYNLSRQTATNADGYVLLTNTGSNSYTITTGQLIIVLPSGNRYFNISGGTLNASGTLIVAFQSEFQQDTAGGINYNQDGNNSAIVMAKPLAGVVATNPPSTFTTPVLNGASVGTLTPSGSSGGDFHYIIVDVDVNGNITNQTAAFSYSLDGAAAVAFTPSYSGQTATYTIPSTGGVVITLSDNGFGALNTTFYAGDNFQFQTPGSWLYQNGIDAETNLAYAQRCINQWNQIADIPTNGFYQNLIAEATSANFPNLGVQATNKLIFTDGYVNGRVNCVVAGPNGPLSTQAVSDLQDFVSKRCPITDKPVILSPSTATITLVGTVSVSNALGTPPIPTIQLNVNEAIINYIETLGINPGFLTTAPVELAKITWLAMSQLGVTNITGLKINGVAADLTLGDTNTYFVPVITTATINLVYTVAR